MRGREWASQLAFSGPMGDAGTARVAAGMQAYRRSMIPPEAQEAASSLLWANRNGGMAPQVVPNVGPNPPQAGRVAAAASAAIGGPAAIAIQEKMTSALQQFAQPANGLASAMRVFGAHADKLIAVLEKFPQTIDMKAQVTHIHQFVGLERMNEFKEALINEAGKMMDQKIDQFAAEIPGAPRRAM